jgi:long-chain fatty acid transport protein
VGSALCIACAASSASASGFLVQPQDATSLGRGGAFAANPSNASAVWYNPAGIANLDGFQADLGATLLAPRWTYTNPTTGSSTSANNSVDVLPTLYATYRIDALDRMLSVGIGVNSPFGGNVMWPAGSAAASVALQQTIESVYVSPEVGINLSRWVQGLSLGGGVDIVDATVYLSRSIPFGNVLGSSQLGASTVGVGGRGGIVYKPKWVRGLSLGAVYRSPVSLNFTNGTADFTAPAEFRGSLPPDGKATTSFSFSPTVAAGVSYRPVPPLEFEFDVFWTGWSSFQQLSIGLPGGSSIVAPKNYADTIGIGVGADWAVVGPLAVRTGFMWEPSPVPSSTIDFTLPDTAHYIFTLGLGYQILPQLRIDGAVGYNFKASVTTTGSPEAQVQGRYDQSALIAGLNLGVALGRAKPQEAPE